MLDRTDATAQDGDLVDRTAASIYRFYLSYRHGFRRVTRKANRRFAENDWSRMQGDAGARFDIYQDKLTDALTMVNDLLGADVESEGLWGRIRSAYVRMIGTCEDRELAETFFNSVARRIFSTVGVNPAIEFVSPESGARDACTDTPVVREFRTTGTVADLMVDILSAYDVGIPFDDRERDAHRLVSHVTAALNGGMQEPYRASMARMPFFRGKGAYLIGAFHNGKDTIPLAVALINRNGRAVCDGLITSIDGIRLLFSYSHSYFHVDTDSAVELVRFLRDILPDKRPAEFFISLGYNRHGKTELYRDLIRHQSSCQQPFDISPGKRGMVMAVFNMPGDDLVFKMIKDRFAKPKRTTRREVMGKYDFVARHDRAGRLPDTQRFEFLKFDRCCFSDPLLELLASECAQSISIGEDDVVLNFVYVERRVIPLDVYASTASPESAEAAVVEFGNAIKDLAHSNIFPGDMLLKNFGVTGLGRVIFYDYDEICPLTDCRFRRKPKARSIDDEMAADPWYHVEENDIFPEEFGHFLGLTGRLRKVFIDTHGDLLDVDFWQRAQGMVMSGKRFNIFPYQRFTATSGDP